MKNNSLKRKRLIKIYSLIKLVNQDPNQNKKGNFLYNKITLLDHREEL